MRRQGDNGLEGPPAIEWLARPERGTVLGTRLTAWIALNAGRSAARLLLYPVSLYFLLSAGAARRASRRYLARALGRAPGLADMFRHYYAFAATILDRVYLFNDQYSRFDVRTQGTAIVDDVLERGEGCILLGSHLGSFEIVRFLGVRAKGLRVSLVMYEENARKLNSVLKAINPEMSADVIPLGKPESMLKVEEALRAGACVGMLGDRTIEADRYVTCSFLGAPAKFALGPLRLAAMLRRPVVLMFGLYRGTNRYDVHFERLADFSTVDRNDRRAAIEDAVRRYAERLEHYCRLAPYNWFNFYDFWA